ncbi:MAG: M67 family metallopeptidase [Deltaproteobacteria bacterium]|jgi:proteasome lid subunit RPN8/RPN11|nr:M67 family metallopeptidase [Deltaproteobacteria bacterium]
MIILPLRVESDIRGEARRAYPWECCGLIVGTSSAGVRRAARIVPLNNAREGEERRRRFAIDPLDFARAEREAAREGLEVWGIYHSHPDHPAAPSARDLERALPFYSYVIVAARDGEDRELNSFLLASDRSRMEPEEVWVGEK